MKTLSFIFRTLLLIIVFAIFITCDIEVDRDECDGTVAHEKSFSIMAAVHVRDFKNLPLKDQEIKVSFYKIPCGSPSKGQIYFNGLTDSEGNFYTTEANYSLRNTKDEIMVEVFAPNLENSSKKDNTQYITITYDDFISETLKVADITLNRKW
jgi:hypothetical protein